MDGQQLYTTDSHIDNQGNIYTVGFNSNSTSDTTYSCIINKFSSQGLHQYSKKYFTGGGSVSPTITSDFERNIYVVGELNIRKLDHAGNLLLEFPHNSTNIKKIDVDSTENIYLFSVFTDNDNGKFGPIIRKFNPYGIELWDFVPFSLNLQNGENAILNDAILDLEGNSIITGSMFRSGERSIFTAHIDFNGLLIWENVFSLSGKTKISGNKLIKSDNGTVYVTGYCGREYYTNSYDALTLSISNEGNLAWYKTFDVNSDEDQAFDIKAFNSGVVISGISNVCSPLWSNWK